jgi:hypothetical protein
MTQVIVATLYGVFLFSWQSKSKRTMPNDDWPTITNPLTGRDIRILGLTYNKLVHTGTFPAILRGVVGRKYKPTLEVARAVEYVHHMAVNKAVLQSASTDRRSASNAHYWMKNRDRDTPDAVKALAVTLFGLPTLSAPCVPQPTVPPELKPKPSTVTQALYAAVDVLTPHVHTDIIGHIAGYLDSRVKKCMHVCDLGTQKCCQCLDKRASRHDGLVRDTIYIDGKGDVTRWIQRNTHYCPCCKVVATGSSKARQGSTVSVS